MLIKFTCPHCKISLNVGSDFAGKKGVCPNCKKELTVPGKSENAPEEAKKTE
ncbi:MAG: hypothetical protein JXN61_02985 [Sedimentisphaerales bacterium]|nr:hypothetical protein [Sedimentisphaerales bacterium]